MQDGADRRLFRERISGFLAAVGQRRSRKWMEVLPRLHTPVELAILLIEQRLEELAGKPVVAADGEEFALTAADAAALGEKASWAEHHDGADVKVLNDAGQGLVRILQLQEESWDDEVTVVLNGRDVAQCSPGQRCSAMLPLIALAESSPLVIDQPEDNLDNSLVGGVLVRILAELKEQRQIVVSTHNPNIVVLGDAEQVIPLDAESDRRGFISPCAPGSIDNDDIVKTVIRIMEGGEAAFKARKKRYNF